MKKNSLSAGLFLIHVFHSKLLPNLRRIFFKNRIKKEKKKIKNHATQWSMPISLKFFYHTHSPKETTDRALQRNKDNCSIPNELNRRLLTRENSSISFQPNTPKNCKLRAMLNLLASLEVWSVYLNNITQSKTNYCLLQLLQFILQHSNLYIFYLFQSTPYKQS